jgi:hypothetical protein
MAAVIPQTGMTPVEVPVREGPRAGLSIGFVGRLVPERGAEMFRSVPGVRVASGASAAP